MGRNKKGENFLGSSAMKTNRNLKKLTKYLRSLDQHMTMFQLEAFLLVAESPGITMREVEQQMGVQNATTSRNIAYWCKWRKYQVPGMDFLEIYPDPRDRRYKIVELTPKGEAFLSKVNEVMGD